MSALGGHDPALGDPVDVPVLAHYGQFHVICQLINCAKIDHSIMVTDSTGHRRCPLGVQFQSTGGHGTSRNSFSLRRNDELDGADVLEDGESGDDELESQDPAERTTNRGKGPACNRCTKSGNCKGCDRGRPCSTCVPLMKDNNRVVCTYPGRNGRKVSNAACRNCVKAKVAKECTRERPCARCEDRNLTCTYRVHVPNEEKSEEA